MSISNVHYLINRKVISNTKTPRDLRVTTSAIVSKKYGKA